MKAKIEAMPDGAHRIAGKYDNAGRWYPYQQFEVPGSFEVRSPSRAYPYSYLKHFYSTKYARLLFKSNPFLYMKMHGLTKRHKKGKALIAQYAAERMGVI